jgi:hypothetical protein
MHASPATAGAPQMQTRPKAKTEPGASSPK